MAKANIIKCYVCPICNVLALQPLCAKHPAVETTAILASKLCVVENDNRSYLICLYDDRFKSATVLYQLSPGSTENLATTIVELMAVRGVTSIEAITEAIEQVHIQELLKDLEDLSHKHA